MTESKQDLLQEPLNPQEKEIEIDINAARIIAERIGDSRALEGTLLSIYAKTLGKKDKIDLESIEEYFNDRVVTEIKNKRLSPHDIIKAVCAYYNIKQALIKDGGRSENIVLPRQIIMYLLRRELKLKYEEIAYILKRKDHTTILHGENKINNLIINNALLKKEVDGIISSLSSSTR